MRALRAAGAPAVVLAAVATGCAGEGGPDAADAEASLARAPAATAAAESAKVSFAATMSVEDGESVDFGGEGVLDLDDDRSRVQLDMSEMASFATPTPGDPDDWRGTVIATPEGTLMQLGAFAGLTEEGKWIRWTGDSLVRQGGAQFAAPDPVELLRLVGALDAVEVVGSDDVAGVETTHLRGDVAPADIPVVAPEAERREAQGTAQRLAAAGLDAIRLDVWVDGDDRVRRVEALYDDLQVSSARRVDIVARMELSDFGGPGDVRVPPSHEIVDVGDVIGRGPEETEHSEE